MAITITYSEERSENTFLLVLTPSDLVRNGTVKERRCYIVPSYITQRNFPTVFGWEKHYVGLSPSPVDLKALMGLGVMGNGRFDGKGEALCVAYGLFKNIAVKPQKAIPDGGTTLY